jgi:hypothetical protein
VNHSESSMVNIPNRAWLIRSKGNVPKDKRQHFRCEVTDHLVIVILLCEKRCALVTGD